MKTTNEIHINATPEKIFRLAAATTEWPRLLRHYRFVRVLTDGGTIRTLHMGARRNWVNVAWVAEQTNLADIPEIRFTHIRGWTRGMNVTWNFLPAATGTTVVISHQLNFRFPLAADWIAKHVIGDFFIKNIADKTLARIKYLAEQKNV